MPTYKTPDVYIEEISTFPPSVAEVATAIPAFIGYTKKTTRKGKSLINEPVRVKSLLQYVETFGGAPDPEEIEVTLSGDNNVEKVNITPSNYLFDSIRMFYANGGGDCYVVSVGSYGDSIALGKPGSPNSNPGFKTGLAAIGKVDEPTILVAPDSVLLGGEVDLGEYHKAALAQCGNLKDRFAVLDLKDGHKERSYDDNDVITRFRSNTGMQDLKYGAAYYPWIRSSLDYKVDYENVKLVKGEGNSKVVVNLASVSGNSDPVKHLDKAVKDRKTLKDYMNDPLGNGTPLIQGYRDIGEVNGPKAEMKERAGYIDDILVEFLNLSFSNTEVIRAYQRLTDTTADPNSEPAFKGYANTLKSYDLGYPQPQNNTGLGVVDDNRYPKNGSGNNDYEMGNVSADDVFSPDAEIRKNGRAAFQKLFDRIVETLKGFMKEIEQTYASALETVQETNPIYQEVLKEIGEEALTMPPSGAIAGVYATVDNDRGVWKAPANVSLAGVIGPAVKVTHDEQEELNVDPTTGKSVNAIRQFTGKGTMVWGARTLAGNSNEWRYVPVRRFFNMVEESVKKSTYWAVFEPNDKNTWVKVRSMIENYLTQKWREGALAGAKPDQAFFVRVGLGQTMTQQDILEGRMIVEIGMAAVRPAEFIILKFSHKLQETG